MKIRYILAALALAALGTPAMAQTFTVAPLAGTGPFTVTWDVPGGTSCQAAGDITWTGAVAATGTKAIQPTIGSKPLTLVCTVPDTPIKGSVKLNWTPATQNTDGTPYTNAKDVLVNAAMQGQTPQVIATVPVGTSTYTATNLDAGTWFFNAQSRSTTGILSDISTIVSKAVTDTLTTKSWTGTQTVNVTAPPKPKAPVLSIE